MIKKITLYSLVFYSMNFLVSCSTLDKASTHGFNSGYYMLDSGAQKKSMYVDVTEEKIDVYPLTNDQPDKTKQLSIPYENPDSFLSRPLKFKKQSLDIDITTILLKYRPGIEGMPDQLTSDLNLAMYLGWRHDRYTLKSKRDPLGKSTTKISTFGYDIGIFGGPGTSPINPFTTNNKTANEYNGMIFQTGIAAFLESEMASFGFATGFDYLLNNDSKIWIYNGKPWIGFVVGIDLN